MKKILLLVLLLVSSSLQAQQGVIFPGKFHLFDGAGASPSMCWSANAGAEFCTFAEALGLSLAIEASDGADLALTLTNTGAGVFNLGLDGGVFPEFIRIDAAPCIDVDSNEYFRDDNCNTTKDAGEPYFSYDSPQSKCINIDPASATTNWLMFKVPAAATVTGIDCLVDAATSVVLTPRECDADGANCSDIEAAITCATTNTTEASGVDNASLDAGDTVRVTLGSVTGSPTQAFLCVEYTVN